MEPSIPDWISAIASLLGIPALLFGIGRLFIKDKEKQRQLNSLDSLASTQAQSIEELTKQTSEYQYHSTLMKESNDLLARQIELQNEIFLHQQVTTEQKADLEQRKRKAEIKPHFIFDGASSNPDGFSLRLLNKGKTARQVTFDKVDDEQAQIRSIDINKEYDQNTKLEITGNANRTKTNLNSNQVSFNIILKYSDVDGNNYKQEVSRRQHSFNITNPVETE
jgi:multidrug efflux pump subunit AcrA (membrane-fusion protein)